ncbi:hypothetical protein Cni_G26404 [Canna indica]|uniref:Late embryogenesis abundant protein LEA-2 subgroup domain-containing protein n=1 Tax=Canna indica TaxID=4628 RepID=A0AAQ3QQG4_9LILI|nr:hypothetical protein Cni_G26404 [Canna indica]
MAATQAVAEEQEALFHSSPCAIYYVQSPSTASHTNSHPASESTAFLSPFTHVEIGCFPGNNRARGDEASRFTLSRYSSSRGSNNSFLQEKKASSFDGESRDAADAACRGKKGGERQRLRIVGVNDREEGEDGAAGRRSGAWRFVSLDPSSSCCCVAFQVTWRLLVSLGFAFLVFFLATKPPQPHVSFKVAGIKQFSLREGLDNTGVVTKLLTCNCSMEMLIDNHSKVFGLHIRPSTMAMAFEHFKFASSLSEASYVDSESSSVLPFYLGTKNKPMYGAGRSMEDMLESGRGLPLVVRVRSRSSYRVIWNLVRSSYHHDAECYIVLNGEQDLHDHSVMFNSTCFVSTSHA